MMDNNKEQDKKQDKKAFFYKNINNIILLIIAIMFISFIFGYRFSEDEMTGADRIWARFNQKAEHVTNGCEKPKTEFTEGGAL